MIEVDAALAIVVLIILFGTLFGLIWWARGAAPYDDGMGRSYANYLPEPMEDEGWAEPPPRTKAPWERSAEPAIPVEPEPQPARRRPRDRVPGDDDG